MTIDTIHISKAFHERPLNFVQQFLILFIYFLLTLEFHRVLCNIAIESMFNIVIHSSGFYSKMNSSPTQCMLV